MAAIPKTKVTAQPVKIEDQYLDTMFESYPDLSGGSGNNPSYFILMNNEGEAKPYGPHVCHATMHYADKGWDTCITAVPQSDEFDLMYLRMLINGPFRSFSPHISLEQRGKHHFIRVANLDQVPGKVLYNFCIATRVPIEHQYLMKGWKVLMDKGVDPMLALLVAYRIKFIGLWPWSKDISDKMARAYTNENHLWFDAGVSWSAVLAGEMVWDSLGPVYKENTDSCRPCNMIWPQWKPEDRAKIANLTLEALCEHFGLPLVMEVKAPPKKRGTKFPGIDYEAGVLANHVHDIAVEAPQPPGWIIQENAPGQWGFAQQPNVHVHPQDQANAAAIQNVMNQIQQQQHAQHEVQHDDFNFDDDDEVDAFFEDMENDDEGI